MIVGVIGLAGCGAGASVPPTEPPGQVPTAVASLPPSETAAAESDLPLPPGASLCGGGDAPVAGLLGTWTLDGSAVEAPWPGAAALEAVEVNDAARLAVAFDDGTPIGAWTARLADAADVTAAGIRAVGQGDASGAASIDLPALRSGAWVLEVHLTRADGRGEASYYWAIQVI